jgi:hypothetical protein
VKIVTQTAPGALAATEYADAQTKIEAPFLVITHRDAQTKARQLSRVPLQNIVQILEDMPDKVS